MPPKIKTLLLLLLLFNYNWYSHQAIDVCTCVDLFHGRRCLFRSQLQATRLLAETFCPHRLLRSRQSTLHHLHSKRYRPYSCVDDAKINAGQTHCCSSWLRGNLRKYREIFQRTWNMSSWAIEFKGRTKNPMLFDTHFLPLTGNIIEKRTASFLKVLWSSSKQRRANIWVPFW